MSEKPESEEFEDEEADEPVIEDDEPVGSRKRRKPR